MLGARCKVCGTEITSTPKVQCCGCPNMMTVEGDKISAQDLSKVVLSKTKESIKNEGFLTSDDLKYQEARRRRKITKLTFEER